MGLRGSVTGTGFRYEKTGVAAKYDRRRDYSTSKSRPLYSRFRSLYFVLKVVEIKSRGLRRSDVTPAKICMEVMWRMDNRLQK